MKYTLPLLLLCLIGVFALTAETWVLIAFLGVFVYTTVILTDAFLFKGEVFNNAEQPLVISALMQLLILFAIPFVEVDFSTTMGLWWAFGAGVSNILGFWLYFKSIEIDQDAVVITVIMNLLIALVPILAFFLIDEQLDALQYGGIGLIFLGTMIASYQKAKANFRIILLMLGSVILLSLSLILMKQSFNLLSATDPSSAYWTGMVVRALGCGTVGLLFSFKMSADAVVRNDFWKLIKTYGVIFFLAEALEICGDMLTSFAMLEGDVSVIASMDGLMGVISTGLCILIVYACVSLRIDKRFTTLAISIRDQHLEHYGLKMMGILFITIGTYLTI